MEEPTNRELNENAQAGKAEHDFEDFEIAEEELIDAYVRNELSAEDSKLVEKGLRTSPQLVARLHFARMLARASSAQEFTFPTVAEPETFADHTQTEIEKRSWWKGFFSAAWVPQPAFRVALSFGLIFVLVGGVALIFGWIKLRDEANRLARERAAVEQQRQELEKRLAEQRSKEQPAPDQKLREPPEAPEKTLVDSKPPQRPRDQTSPPISNFAHILLIPTGSRGGESRVLTLSPAASGVRFDLSLETTDYSRYRVMITSATGKKITQQDVERSPSSSTLSIRVPAKRFRQGDYQIRVSGLTSSGAFEVENYVFRVIEKKD